MATLYELSTEYQQLLEVLENTTDDQTLIDDTIASTGINDALEDKFEGYGQVINQIKADIKSVQAELKRLSDKKKVYQNNLERLQNNLLNSMAATGKSKVKTPLFNFTVRNSLSVEITDIDKLPVEVVKVQPVKPDKIAIKKLLQDGEDVPGAKLELSESLTVR